MREAELAEVFDRIWAKSSTRNWIIGRLGVYDGTPEEIDVEGRPGYVRVIVGNNGDQGVTIAKDAVGAARIVFQEVRMRRELGELVIREASAYAGGTSGGGGGGGALDDLSDVVISTPSSGQIIQYNGSSWVNVSGGAGMAAHDLSGAYHTGLLDWVDVNKVGSSLAHLATRNHDDLDPASITPDQHHAKVHPLVGPEHTATGLTPGYSVIATTPTTFAWAQAKHTDLDPASVLPDQHHDRAHDIILGDGEPGPVHTITGAAFQVVGATASNVLGLLTPTHDPGATEKILKTSSNGSLFLDTTLFVVNAATDQVTIDTTLLVADSNNNWIGINRTPSGAALDIIAATTTDITQRIKQKAGQTNRLWRIEDSAGSELIVLDSVGNLQSGQPGFYSGLMGWQITPTGNAEFNNIWARGELHATIFVKDEVHASGGTLLVATAGKLHAAAEIDAGTTDNEQFEVFSSVAAFPSATTDPLTIQTTNVAFSGTTLYTEGIGNRIEIDDPPSGPGFYFTPGEILRVKTEVNEEGNPLKLADLWLEVMSATQASGYSIYSVTKRSGSDCTIPAGTGIVSYGQRGDGRILMTSDLNYAPYLDVFTTGENPWAGGVGDIIPRLRLGQLMGVGVTGVSGVSQYGMIAGSDLTNNNAGYLIASNLGIRLYKVPIILNNGVTNTGYWAADGNLYVGKNVGDPGAGDLQPTTTGLRVITTNEAGQEGNVIIGNEGSGHFLRWNQAGGTLTVAGDLVVDMPDTGTPQSYVDSQDTYYNGLATGYGSSAYTNSQAYFNARHVNKVTGTWDSTAANTISCSGVVIHFANGTTRTVTNYSTGVMGARTYLFIDLGDVTGNLDFIASTTPTISNVNYVLIAVCDLGAVKASVNVVAGGTYISGGNIFTNSIAADRIVANSLTAGQIAAGAIDTDELAAGAVTAAKIEARTITANEIAVGTITANELAADSVTAAEINVANLQAVSSNTGNLTVTNAIMVGDSGFIHSTNKAAYGDPDPGFFLGYNSGHKFDLGNSANYLRWDGNSLLIKTVNAMIITADSGTDLFEFHDKDSLAVANLQFVYASGTPTLKIASDFQATRLFATSRFEVTSSGSLDNKEVLSFQFGANRRALSFNGGDQVLTYSGDFATQTVFCEGHRINGTYFHFAKSSAIASSFTAGVEGDIRWSWDGTNGYFYVCVAANNWRRAVLLNF